MKRNLRLLFLELSWTVTFKIVVFTCVNIFQEQFLEVIVDGIQNKK
jgi:hypothetical protein